MAMNATPRDVEAAVACLDSTGWDADVWAVRGGDLASTLKTVLDKLGATDLTDLPDEADSDPFEQYANPSGRIVLAKLAAGKGKGEWRFSAETLRSLDALLWLAGRPGD